MCIRDRRIAEAAAIRKLFDSCGDLIETTDKIFFIIYFISVAPAGIIVVEGDSAVLTDDDGLSFVYKTVCKGRFMLSLIHIS